MVKQYPETHVIAIAGMIASGKDYISDMITRQRSIPKTTVSTILRQIAKENGNENPTRQELINISNALTAEHDGDGAILAKKTLEQARSVDVSELQIVGMRQSPQMVYLMQNIGRLTSVFLHTHNQIRLDRERARGNNWASLDEFIAKEIDQNTGSNNDLYNFPALCRYQYLSDGSVIDMGVMDSIPASMPKYDRDTHKVLLSQDPGALKELFSKGNVVISSVPALATVASQQSLHKNMQGNPELAGMNTARTWRTIKLILDHSDQGDQVLDEHAYVRQSRD